MKAIDPSIRLQAMIEATDWTCEDEALPLDEEYFRQVQETIARFYEEGRKTVSPTDIDIGLRYAPRRPRILIHLSAAHPRHGDARTTAP